MNKLDSTIREEKMRYNRMMENLETYMKENSIKDIKSITQDDLDNIVLKSKNKVIGESRSGLYNNIKIINQILKESGSNIELNSSDYVDKLKFNEDKYFTRKEIREICDLFTNSQDKFIVYALWNGIMGKDYEDLLNLKIEDIVYDENGNPKYLKVKNNRIECDEYMQEVLKDTLEDDYYETYNNTNSGILGFDLNMNSPYIIKGKPSKRNNNGLDPMRRVGIQTRLKRLTEMFRDTDIRRVHLTGKTLERSGVMFDMFLKEAYEQVEWTIEEIAKYLELKCIKGSVNDIYRAYHQKYHESTVLE